MGILLKEALLIYEQEWKYWTIGLNSSPDGKIFSFSDDNEKLMAQLSLKKRPDEETAYRVLTKFSLQFLRIEPEGKTDRWLFLGAFENCGTRTDFEDGHEEYILKPINRFSAFSERLIMQCKHINEKINKVKVDKIEEFEIATVLDRKYIEQEKPFPGYSNLSLSLADLAYITGRKTANWYSALSSLSCIYAVTDTKTGKFYITSTYGSANAYDRWSDFVNNNAAGYNKDLIGLVNLSDEYKPNFRISVIEAFPNVNGKSARFMLEREKFWKAVLPSPGFTAEDITGEKKAAE